METASRPDPQTCWPSPLSDRHEAIRRRAEEIYVRSGRIPGRDLENWSQAEQEVARESAPSPVRRTAIVVKVNGVRFVGEYAIDSAEGYTPGEFPKGMPVPVRFEGDKMFVRRPNGKELETRIVKTSSP